MFAPSRGLQGRSDSTAPTETWFVRRYRTFADHADSGLISRTHNARGVETWRRAIAN